MNLNQAKFELKHNPESQKLKSKILILESEYKQEQSNVINRTLIKNNNRNYSKNRSKSINLHNLTKSEAMV